MPETRDVELLIVLEDPTPGVWGGVQIGSGSKATVKDWQKMSGPEARFIAHAQIRKSPLPLEGEGAGGEGVPKSAKGGCVLTGPVIQKDGKGRFLYIVWRDHTGLVSRRAKIYVESIDQAMLNKSPLAPVSDEGGLVGERGSGGEGAIQVSPSLSPRGTSLDMRKGPGDGVNSEEKVQFEILLPGKAKDGLPCCATVKPIRDWRPT